MSEAPDSSNRDIGSDAEATKWYPSEEELAQFEAVRNERLLPDEPLEKFVADKVAGPTPEEIETWRLWNRDMNFYPNEDMSFEAFFGRPDPRVQDHPEAHDDTGRSS